MFTVTLEAEDRLALFTGLGSNNVLLPKRTITRNDFADAPDDAIGRPVPIVYGDFTRSLSATLPPQLVQNLSKGLLNAANFSLADEGRSTGLNSAPFAGGVGSIASPDPPASVTLSIREGGEIQRTSTVWTPRLYVSAATINASGTYSEPYPYWSPTKAIADATGATACYIDFTADNVKLVVDFTWPSGATTGWQMAVYCGHNYYGVRMEQVIFVVWPSTRATFDRFVWPWEPNGAATGASYVHPHIAGGWFGVAAVTAGGETGLSPLSRIGVGPYMRPAYLEWTAVPGATSYKIYSVDPASAVPLAYWDVGAVTSAEFDVSAPDGTADTSIQRNGPVPLIHVGTRTASDSSVWQAFLLCGHAVAGIETIYQNGTVIDPGRYGVDLAVPGKTGFPGYWGSTPYVDLNGNRYTLVYARGQIATDAVELGLPLSCAPRGIEDSATGDGTLIENLYDQYLHFLKNWVLASYTSGSWTTVSPTWGDTPYDVPIVDDSSFAKARDLTTARVSGGYVGAWCVGAESQETVRTWIGRLNQSADCYCGFSRDSQFVVKALAPVTNAAQLPLYAADLGILRDSFSVRDDTTAIENRINYHYDYNYTAGAAESSGTEQDTAIQTAMGGEIKPYELTLYGVRSAVVAADIAARRLLRKKYPYRIVSWECDMGALMTDLGDVVAITHPDGPDATGWTRRPVWILRHEFAPGMKKIRLEALDIAHLVTRTATLAEAVTVTDTATVAVT